MINLKSVQRRNPSDPTAQKKYYATVITAGSTKLKELAEMVALQTTVSPTDCHAVLMALEGNVIRELRKGKIVRLGELGSYRLSVHAEGRETPEDVNTDAVKKTRIIFRPGEGMSDMLRTLKFKKIQEKSA